MKYDRMAKLKVQPELGDTVEKRILGGTGQGWTKGDRAGGTLPENQKGNPRSLITNGRKFQKEKKKMMETVRRTCLTWPKTKDPH